MPAYRVDQLLFQDDQRRATTHTAVDAALRPFQDPRRPQARALTSAVSRQVDELITLFADAGGSGWVDLCAQPLPLMVVNRLFGFPVGQDDEIFMDAWHMMDSGPDAAAAIRRLLTATTELAAHKQPQPGNDLTSRLLAAEPSRTVEQVGRELYAVLVAIAGTTTSPGAPDRISARAGVLADTMVSAAVGRRFERCDLELDLPVDQLP